MPVPPAGAPGRDRIGPVHRPKPAGPPGPGPVRGHRQGPGGLSGTGASGLRGGPGPGPPARDPVRRPGAARLSAPGFGGPGGKRADHRGFQRRPDSLPAVKRLLPGPADPDGGPGGPGVSGGEGKAGPVGPPRGGAAAVHSPALRPVHRRPPAGLFHRRGQPRAPEAGRGGPGPGAPRVHGQPGHPGEVHPVQPGAVPPAALSHRLRRTGPGFAAPVRGGGGQNPPPVRSAAVCASGGGGLSHRPADGGQIPGGIGHSLLPGPKNRCYN